LAKWQTDLLKDSTFPFDFAQLSGDSQALVQGYIQDVVNIAHPCKDKHAEPCGNILDGMCLIVFPNSSLRIVIYPEYDRNTIWFVSCRD